MLRYICSDDRLTTFPRHEILSLYMKQEHIGGFIVILKVFFILGTIVQHLISQNICMYYQRRLVIQASIKREPRCKILWLPPLSRYSEVQLSGCVALTPEIPVWTVLSDHRPFFSLALSQDSFPQYIGDGRKSRVEVEGIQIHSPPLSLFWSFIGA